MIDQLIFSSSFFCIIILIPTIVITTFSLPTQVSGLGSGSTISVSFGGATPTICGILAGNSSQKIECYKNGQIISIQPNVSYVSISGGHDFFCGLTSGGFELHCWDTRSTNTSFLSSEIYHNHTFHLTSLSVGYAQLCALQAKTGNVLCWQREASSAAPFKLPKRAKDLDLITSGNGFSCGIEKEDKFVICWGESGTGDLIESQFSKMSMMSLVAGMSHVCGLNVSGILVCKGSNDSGQLNVPPHQPFSFSGLALGANHTCAIQKSNGLVVCWGAAGGTGSAVVKDSAFESIVAGSDFTCGLTRKNLGVICWGPGWPVSNSTSKNDQLRLPMIIPSPCVEEDTMCGSCGIYPDSDTLCAGHANVLCRSCGSAVPPSLSPKQTASSPLLQSDSSPPAPSSATISKDTKDEHKGWSLESRYWPYQVFGSIGILCGLFALGYCIKRTRSATNKHKKIQSQSDTGTAGNLSEATSFVRSCTSSAPQSRSSSITLQSTQSVASSRGRSWSSLKQEKADKFSFSDLATATDNFSMDNRIGSGNFGTVFRGKLDDGRKVAIKREDVSLRRNKIEDEDNAFDLELSLLSRLHHKHLVGLIGVCQHNEERLLVFEYMSNGSLHDHLHYSYNSHDRKEENVALNSWIMRIKVVLDAARGIEYLHNYAVPPIIHRDIKSSNILIDSNWTARVSDFGLSCLGPQSNQEEALAAKAVGTVGYIDPEYYVLRSLTTKSDVYGFGVVLLEILTGKKAVFKNPEETGPIGVVEFAGPFIMEGEVWKVLDRRLGQPLFSEAEAVELVALTAMQCLNLESKDRPTISDVIANLERALTLCKDYVDGSSRIFPISFS